MSSLCAPGRGYSYIFEQYMSAMGGGGQPADVQSGAVSPCGCRQDDFINHSEWGSRRSH